MPSYRPITDSWILCRSKVPYYGAYPAGFLHRARQLLGVGINDPVLHVCGGKIREYPFRGLGPNDKTVDLDSSLNPDFIQDVREPLPFDISGVEDWQQATSFVGKLWPAVLIDRPYTEEDATHYRPGKETLPPLNALVKNALSVVAVGGKVGVLDYLWPQPPKNATEVAVVAVYTGRNNRARQFTVFERLT